jgi:hypothetical protein
MAVSMSRPPALRSHAEEMMRNLPTTKPTTETLSRQGAEGEQVFVPSSDARKVRHKEEK